MNVGVDDDNDEQGMSNGWESIGVLFVAFGTEFKSLSSPIHSRGMSTLRPRPG
jgi:hypothetical protein